MTVGPCSASSVELTADPNPNADPRTARVTVSYSYTLAGTKGTASCEITVAQSCGDQPAISVQPTAVAAAVEGGSYSFSYTIVNPAPDGEVSASCTASWITDIDCSEEGAVGFSVAENTGGLRQSTISLSYSWANGSISETVTVVQDHPAGDDDEDDGNDGGDADIEGTYTMTGVSYYSYPYSTSWTVTIHYEPDSPYTDPENPYLIDGLISAEEGDYPYYAAYCAKARAEGNNIIVPAQITEGSYYLDETNTTEAYLGYVAGYLGSDGYLYAYDNYPDMVFTYNEASGSWSCNYGIMGFLYDTLGDFGSFNEYLIDVTIGDITLVKSGSGGGGGGDYPNYSDMTGTYSCSGYGRVSGGYDNATWNMYITAKSDTEYYVYCLTPYAGGLDIADAGSSYWAVGHWGTEIAFVVPSQVCTGRVNSSSGATYYWGYTPCTEYDGSQWYYSGEYPDLTFTKTGDDTWESDYGVFAAGCTGYDITTFESYFGVVAPTIKATKTSNSVPTALSSGRPLGTAETFSNLKVSSEPAHSNGIRSRRAGARAAR